MDICIILGFWSRLRDNLAASGKRNDYLWFLRIGGGTDGY